MRRWIKIRYLSCDLQKVILLPRLPGCKKCLFTSRLITFNLTFAPIGEKVLWHEENCRTQGPRTSAVRFKRSSSFLSFGIFRSGWIWVDNCGGGGGGGGDKCWTLFTMLVALVNKSDNCPRIYYIEISKSLATPS